MSGALNFEPGLESAKDMDCADELAPFRDRFHIPRMADGSEELYLCGNSLGLQPKSVGDYVNAELDAWRRLGVKGHFEGPHPWMPYHELLAPAMAALVGAEPAEVVAMNTLTVNLHLMMVSFYRPTDERHAILIEEHAFPSDHHAVESQIRYHGYDPVRSLRLVRPRAGEALIRDDLVSNPALLSRGVLDSTTSPTPVAGDPAIAHGDASTAVAMADKFLDELSFAATGGLPQITASFAGYAAEILSASAVAASVAQDTAAFRSTLSEELSYRAQEVSGVNIDEELRNLVLYENAFAATARIIQVVDELFEQLVSIGR